MPPLFQTDALFAATDSSYGLDELLRVAKADKSMRPETPGSGTGKYLV